METIYLNTRNLKYYQNEAERNVIALGFFDGIHRGHQEVIHTAADIAKEKNTSLSVMSFYPHPSTVLSNGETKINTIMPLSEKRKVLQDLGVDRFFIVEFNKEFASLSPQEFVTEYLLKLGSIHAVAGYDFAYGSRGKGNMDRLKADAGGVLGVTKVRKVEHLGRKISSTWIRELLEEGSFEEIPHLLGRHYETEGNWESHSLTLQPYYTLPKAGRYRVTVRTRKGIIITNAWVNQDDYGRVYLLTSSDEAIGEGESVTVAWRNRIQTSAVYA